MVFRNSVYTDKVLVKTRNSYYQILLLHVFNSDLYAANLAYTKLRNNPCICYLNKIAFVFYRLLRRKTGKHQISRSSVGKEQDKNKCKISNVEPWLLEGER